MYWLTFFGFLITTSWHGATLCMISCGLSGLDSACASFLVRSVSSVQPNILLMTFMSPNRLVRRRWLGLPLTLLNSIGQAPSRCFCSPVSSRSGSTGLSVSIRSPSAFSFSSMSRRLTGRSMTFIFSLRTAFCMAWRSRLCIA